MKLRLQSALCLLAGVMLLPARAQSISDWLNRGFGIDHTQFPLYGSSDQKLYSVVRVDRAFTDYEKKGFFHIGALPVLVLDGVAFEVKEPAPAAENLARLSAWLGVDAGKRVELRHVKFQASPTSTLEAGRLRFVARDRWELSQSVRFVSGTNEIRAEQAVWDIGSAHSGRLILQTVPPSTNTFLGLPSVL